VMMEAPRERIETLVFGHGRLKRMVEGQWMRLGRIDPDSDAIELFVDGQWQPWRTAWPEFGPLADGATAAVFDPAHDHVLGGIA
jgi:hypothetical protein